MGEGKVRYRPSSLPKNRSGSGEVISAGTFPTITFLFHAQESSTSGEEILQPAGGQKNQESSSLPSMTFSMANRLQKFLLLDFYIAKLLNILCILYI